MALYRNPSDRMKHVSKVDKDGVSHWTHVPPGGLLEWDDERQMFSAGFVKLGNPVTVTSVTEIPPQMIAAVAASMTPKSTLEDDEIPLILDQNASTVVKKFEKMKLSAADKRRVISIEKKGKARKVVLDWLQKSL